LKGVSRSASERIMLSESQLLHQGRPLSVANKPHPFKDRDIRRVIKAARSAGLDPASVTVDPKTDNSVTSRSIYDSETVSPIFNRSIKSE